MSIAAISLLVMGGLALLSFLVAAGPRALLGAFRAILIVASDLSPDDDDEDDDDWY